ncbi:chaplin [Streptomyces sp. AM8-1-1]|uniref:chaplin n=1 Tax=Streptomyces sp. AM8-1-1 TaxID=3075825 RepID=UPI0028C466AE|nr:chaplin [Streptomyces sp. AM8-1-1]WNO75230.1 chaplin [Streptomyces sp. AM8-1-1]
MRQLHRKGLATVMLTGGALALTGHAYADAGAEGAAAGSPGVLAGNTVQLPVHVPVNVCGNTINVVGLLNPAAGNSCENTSQDDGRRAGHGSKGATAEGGRKDSPGVLSGNGIQLPVDVPVNVTGNSVNVVGIGNASVGNSSSNNPGQPPAQPRPVTPPRPAPPKPVERADAPLPETDVELAHTGSGPMGYAVPTSAALLLGGAMLYRRARRGGA